MFGISTARLARLGRWPRRVAALGCLLLAFASAVTPRHGPRASASGPANPLVARLRDGQVAASVALTDAGAAGFLRAGDRVDLYATPGSSGDPPTCAAAGRTPLGSGLRVLAVDEPSGGLGGDGTGRLVLAVPRGTAADLAALQTCGMFAVLDKDP